MDNLTNLQARAAAKGISTAGKNRQQLSIEVVVAEMSSRAPITPGTNAQAVRLQVAAQEAVDYLEVRH